jgi:hypothetical protein
MLTFKKEVSVFFFPHVTATLWELSSGVKDDKK